MIREVILRGKGVGHRLGSETELMARFGVSRSILREAVRQLEAEGAIRMRGAQLARAVRHASDGRKAEDTRQGGAWTRG